MEILIVMVFIFIAYFIIYLAIAFFIYKNHQKVIAHLNVLIEPTDVNFEASVITRRCLGILVIIIFMFDFSHPQHELNFEGYIFLPMTTLFAAFFFGLVVAVYNFIFHSSLYLGIKRHGMVYFYRLYFLLSLLSIVIFETIWWRWFYTEISLPHRVWGWNLALIVFPFLPLASLFITTKPKTTP